MPAILTVEDLAPFADIEPSKAQAMIDDATALASQVAPCILDVEFPYLDAARAVLRGAILRWNDAGSGALTQLGAGPFQQSIDTRQPRRGMFWPSEIEQLQKLCGSASEAFTVNMTGLPASTNPLGGAVINAHLGYEPLGQWAE